MNPIEWLAMILVASGALFIFAGTVGMLRFPDVFTRLHALTKADNLGLGLIALGLACKAGPTWTALKLLLIWLLVLLAGAVSCHLVAQYARRSGVTAWRREP